MGIFNLFPCISTKAPLRIFTKLFGHFLSSLYRQSTKLSMQPYLLKSWQFYIQVQWAAYILGQLSYARQTLLCISTLAFIYFVSSSMKKLEPNSLTIFALPGPFIYILLDTLPWTIRSSSLMIIKSLMALWHKSICSIFHGKRSKDETGLKDVMV